MSVAKFAIGEIVLLFPRNPEYKGLQGMPVRVAQRFHLFVKTVMDKTPQWRWIYVLTTTDTGELLCDSVGKPNGWCESALRPLPKSEPGEWDESIFVPKDILLSV